MLVLDALEVNMVHDIDSDEKSNNVESFSWELVDFNQDFIWLQVDFENP